MLPAARCASLSVWSQMGVIGKSLTRRSLFQIRRTQVGLCCKPRPWDTDPATIKLGARKGKSKGKGNKPAM